LGRNHFELRGGGEVPKRVDCREKLGHLDPFLVKERFNQGLALTGGSAVSGSGTLILHTIVDVYIGKVEAAFGGEVEILTLLRF